jgi:hypothetical protein
MPVPSIWGDAIEAKDTAFEVLRLGIAAGDEHEGVALGQLEAQNREWPAGSRDRRPAGHKNSLAEESIWRV